MRGGGAGAGERNAAHLAHRLQLAILRRTAVQAEHQQAVFRTCLIERLFNPADARASRLERLFEWTGMSEKRVRLDLMHRVADVPEPQSASGNAECSAWALATDTSRSLLKPPKNSDPHHAVPSFRDSPSWPGLSGIHNPGSWLWIPGLLALLATRNDG